MAVTGRPSLSGGLCPPYLWRSPSPRLNVRQIFATVCQQISSRLRYIVVRERHPIICWMTESKIWSDFNFRYMESWRNTIQAIMLICPTTPEKTLLRYLVKCRARSPLWSKLRCLHQKGDDLKTAGYLCCTATWTSDKQHHKIRYSSGFRSVMLADHISRLMNGVSHGAEARPCQGAINQSINQKKIYSGLSSRATAMTTKGVTVNE